MSNELIRPIDADTAKAIEEASKALGKAIELAIRSGGYVKGVLSDLPHDLVGIIGDWVKHKRIRRWIELQAETDRILKERGIENREEASPSVAIPLIDAAINEEREVLKDLWAKLLASALDPNRAKYVRPSLVDLLKRLDPLDALILETMVKRRADLAGGIDLAQQLAVMLNADRDDSYYSLEHLHELGVLRTPPDQDPIPPVTGKGKALITAIGD